MSEKTQALFYLGAMAPEDLLVLRDALKAMTLDPKTDQLQRLAALRMWTSVHDAIEHEAEALGVKPGVLVLREET